MLGASNGLKARDVLDMTYYELTLWVRGQRKREYHETCRTVSAAHLNASLSRAKKIPDVKKFLPKEPLTNIERREKLWDKVSGLAAMGVGKVKRRKGKK